MVGQEIPRVETPRVFEHKCEVCGLTLLLTPELAFEFGWDYPPRMGAFGIISARTCGNCGIEGTVWWALAMEKRALQELTDEQLVTAQRIIDEPETMARLVGRRKKEQQ